VNAERVSLKRVANNSQMIASPLGRSKIAFQSYRGLRQLEALDRQHNVSIVICAFVFVGYNLVEAYLISDMLYGH